MNLQAPDPLESTALAGAAAGVAASLPMALILDQLNRWMPGNDPQERLPPLKITDRLAEKAGVIEQVPQPVRDAAGFASHLGYGGAMGLLYGLVSPNVSAPPAAKGVAWGLAVWAASYAGWLPAAGILPPPHRRPMRRNVNIILAHVAWGALLGLLTSVFADDEDA